MKLHERGEQSVDGLIRGLKGKLAEIEHKEWLEQNGYDDVEIPLSPTQPVWDISAMSTDGETSIPTSQKLVGQTELVKLNH